MSSIMHGYNCEDVKPIYAENTNGYDRLLKLPLTIYTRTCEASSPSSLSGDSSLSSFYGKVLSSSFIFFVPIKSIIFSDVLL